MRRTLNSMNRLVVGAVGLSSAAAGVLTLLWWQGVNTVVDAAADIDNTAIRSAADQSWWPWVLLGATVLLGLIGLWLLLGNLRPNRLKTVRVGGSSGELGGLREVSVPDVGKAAAKSLERHRHIRSTNTRTYTDGKTPILELTVTADPAVDGRDLIDVLRAVRHQLQLSFEGSDVQVRMLFHRAANN